MSVSRITVGGAEEEESVCADRCDTATRRTAGAILACAVVAAGLPRPRAMLNGADRPALVMLNNEPRKVDRTGELGQILAEHYRAERVIDGVTLLRAARSTN